MSEHIEGARDEMQYSETALLDIYYYQTAYEHKDLNALKRQA